MKKILFLIHDLGQGGAEKVLVNLVNNLDKSKYDIHVTALFGGGINEQFLSNHIKYRTIFKKTFPGNSKIMQLFSPKRLHRWFVKENYDIEISFLEGPSARIISGCSNLNTKTLCWIHSTIKSMSEASESFRSYKESLKCYSEFSNIICVSTGIQDAFNERFPVCSTKTAVLYNTIDSKTIYEKSLESIDENVIDSDCFNIIAVGSLKAVKGFDRLLRIHAKLIKQHKHTRTYILGVGPDEAALKHLADNLGITDSVYFLGYNTNPYKYVRNCDLFVCSSHSEGFSTAATEALIVGTPVCTVDVSGMKEMLGCNNEWGIITENNEESLFNAINNFIENPELLNIYRTKALERGKSFSISETTKAVEKMLDII